MPAGAQSPLFAECALFLDRDVGGAPVLGRLVVRLELCAEVILVAGRERDSRRVATHGYLGRLGPRLAKCIPGGASGELLVQAVSESWHDDGTFGLLDMAT